MIGVGFAVLARHQHDRRRTTRTPASLIVDGSRRPVGTAAGSTTTDPAERRGPHLQGAGGLVPGRRGGGDSTCDCDTIGFLGGQTEPADPEVRGRLHRRREAINPDMEVLVEYIGDDVGRFQRRREGRGALDQDVRDGAEIIYHAPGASGAGLFNAAVKEDKLAIGVDSDQYLTASSRAAAADPHVDAEAGRRRRVQRRSRSGQRHFVSGATVFGLAEDGVDFSKSNTPS